MATKEELQAENDELKAELAKHLRRSHAGNVAHLRLKLEKVLRSPHVQTMMTNPTTWNMSAIASLLADEVKDKEEKAEEKAAQQ